MTDIMNIIGDFRVPERKSETATSFDTRIKHVEQWAKSLPRADIGDTSRLVYHALHEINRLELSDSNRFKIMEILREPVEFVSNSLKKHYIGLAFPLSERKQKIALLTRQLHAEMAIGYKIYVNAKISKITSRFDNKNIISAVHRTVKYLGEVLLHSYQIYELAPDNVWKEIHALYLIAFENDVHKSVMKDFQKEQNIDSSIEALYKKTILLALAGPYRLRQTDLEKVYNSLDQWVQYTELDSIVDPEKQKGMYSVNLVSDDPPAFFTHSSEDDTKFWRVFDTNDLVKIIQNSITNYKDLVKEEGKNKYMVLSRNVLRRLLLSWGGMAKRIFSRTRKNSQVKVSFGLSATHHFIFENEKLQLQSELKLNSAKNKDWIRGIDDEEENPEKLVDFAEPEYDERSRFSSSPVKGVGQPRGRSNDPWDPYYRKELSDFGEYSLNFLDPGDVGPFSSDVTPAHYDIHTCTSINESAGGFCLVWVPWDQEDKPINALVGELIGIQENKSQSDHQWSIGVVRWLKNQNGRQLELGIQKLAPDAVAAGTRNIKSEKKSWSYVRSLVLPELKAIHQSMTIITPSSYQVGDTLELNIFGDKKTIRLTKLLESTGSFTHFQFVDYKKSKQTSPKPKDANSEYDFENLWTSI